VGRAEGSHHPGSKEPEGERLEQRGRHREHGDARDGAGDAQPQRGAEGAREPRGQGRHGHRPSGEPRDEVMSHADDQRLEEAEGLEMGMEPDGLGRHGPAAPVEPREHPGPERRPHHERGRQGDQRERSIDGRLSDSRSRAGRHRYQDRALRLGAP
jgi:hypothetical protein